MSKVRRRLFDIIQIGNVGDLPSRAFDIFITVIIFINLFVTIFDTYEESKPYSGILQIVELITIVIFTIEYILRVVTADYLYPKEEPWKARLMFVFSAGGIIDLLTFFPFYLPFAFPAGMVAFRMLRVVRIFRLFKISTKYDAFNVIVDVINEKRKQILSAVVLILIFMVASSLAMYSLEHDAQPECFRNAFSGIWWSVSTLLTVGYGDIYPITTAGKVLAIVISFLGVGMVAIPTGIISAGFVEQYTKINKITFKAEEKPIRFVNGTLGNNHPWVGKKVKDVVFPPEILLTVVLRGDEEIVPTGNLVLEAGDSLVLGARHFANSGEEDLRELIIKDENDWVGRAVKDLDISRHELIVMIQRKQKTIIPNGNTVIRSGDHVVMYSKHNKKIKQ